MNEETAAEEKGKKLEDIRKEAEKKHCPVQKALYFINEYIEGPMCGRCYPCALGTKEAKIRLIRICQHLHDVSPSDIEALKRISKQMIEGSFCKKGKDTGRFITEILALSENEFNQHVSGSCTEKECINIIEYIINPDLCIRCGKCLEACTYNAIIGGRGNRSFEIRQERCTKCGDCLHACPTDAIEVITTEIDELVSINKI
jgi:NAD-dependent dihydropyrimidine dehydrogenase PreA subunit